MPDLYARSTRLRPPLVDALLLAGIVFALFRIEWTLSPARTCAETAVAVGAIAARRRWPVPALAITTVALLPSVILKAASTGLLLTAGVLMYSVALYTARRAAWVYWVYAATVSAAVIGTGMLVDFGEWWKPNTVGVLTWFFGAGAVGDASRNRRAYIAEVTERARQAEQTREEEARRRVMDERLRIARELHDVVAHHIAVINVQAGAAGHVLRDRPAEVWPVLEHIREASDTVLREIQSVIGVLRDPGEADSTEPSPGVGRLPSLVANLAATGFRVEFRESGAARPLPAIVDLAAYRIAQEALTNAHRYGQGSATLSLSYSPASVTVEVTNAVAGPPGTAAPGPGSGFGLLGMRERAAAAHGSVSAGPADDGTFRVRAELPLAEAAVIP